MGKTSKSAMSKGSGKKGQSPTKTPAKKEATDTDAGRQWFVVI